MNQMNNTGITAITGEALETMWSQVYAILNKVVTDAGESMPELYEDLMEQRASLVVYVKDGVIEAAVITEVIEIGPKMCLNIRHLAGKDRRNWLHHLPMMEAWAKDQDIDSILISRGREGWREILKPHGYKLQAIILEKDL